MGRKRRLRKNRAEPTPATVTAQGVGWVEVVPDAATVSVGVQAVHADLAAAREEAAQKAAAINAAAKAAGVPERDVQTSAYRIQRLRDTGAEADPTATRGYEVSNIVAVTARDLERLPALLDAVAAAGANQIQGPEFFVQHPEEAATEARLLAMASARRRAETLAAAEGATLVRVRSIGDRSAQAGPMPRMARSSLAESASPTPIEAGSERIAAAVEVVWEIA